MEGNQGVLYSLLFYVLAGVDLFCLFWLELVLASSSDDDASPCCLGVLLNFCIARGVSYAACVCVHFHFRTFIWNQEYGPPTTIQAFSPVRLRNWACFCFHRVWPRKMARCELTTTTNPQSSKAFNSLCQIQ